MAGDRGDASRPYRSALREDQARATRRRIVDAARDLFVEHGYARTTIDAIAARADVSRKTVFTAVGGKSALLKLAWDWALAGDDEPVAIADRAEVRRMAAERDPDRIVADWARLQATIATRLTAPYHVLVVAADADPEAAELLAFNEGNRAAGARAFIEHLAGAGGLRDDLDAEQASAIAEVLMDPAPAGRLVGEHGWALEEYIAFVERSARALLLRPPDALTRR